MQQRNKICFSMQKSMATPFYFSSFVLLLVSLESIVREDRQLSDAKENPEVGQARSNRLQLRVEYEKP